MRWLSISILLIMPAANSIPLTATPVAGSETVVYSVLRPTNWDIYLFASRGTSPQRLTTDPALDYNAVFSPSGLWVVFCSERRGNPDLYVLDLSNRKPGAPLTPKLLIDSPSIEDAPAFSPDGKTLAFVSTRDGEADIFTIPFAPDKTQSMNAANVTNLTPRSATTADTRAVGNFNPAFSPDDTGSKIVFSSDRGTINRGDPPVSVGSRGSKLYVMNRDGTNLTPLDSTVPTAGNWQGSPVWSSDGYIYYYDVKDWAPDPPPRIDRGEPHIMRARAGGSSDPPQQVSPANTKALSPALIRDAPSGDMRVAFSAYVKDRWQISSVNPDGSDLRDESDTQQYYWAPAFDQNDKNGRMVCHGTGPLSTQVELFIVPLKNTIVMNPQTNNDNPPLAKAPLLVAGSTSQVNLSDNRTVELRGFRTFTSAINSLQNRIAGSVAVLNKGRDVITFAFNGSGIKTAYHQEGKGAWGVTWSNDANWIAFALGEPFSGPQPLQNQMRTVPQPVGIWKVKMNPDGTGIPAVRVTPEGDKRNNAWPDFSKDGSRIIFRKDRDLYWMDAAGQNVTKLTDHGNVDWAIDTMPAWSPVVSPTGDSLIAFTSTRTDRDFEIYTLQIGPDGKPKTDSSGNTIAPQRITFNPGDDVHPRFSPDGKWLVFTSELGGINDEEPLNPIFNPQPYGEIWAVLLADGKPAPNVKPVRLTQNKWEDGVAWWSPAGK